MINVSSKTVSEINESLGAGKIESGGLLGSLNNGDIDVFFFDSGIDCNAGEYNPDIKKLNEQLSEWDRSNIAFRGIIHSHMDKKELSPKDVFMARKLLNANSLSSVLMPVYVINSKSIIWYEVTDKTVKYMDHHVIK